MVYLVAFLCTGFAILVITWRSMIWMPGRSFHGIPTLLDETESHVRESLQQDLRVLAHEIGERNLTQRYPQLIEAAEFIEQTLRDAGYEIHRQEITVDGKLVSNIDAQCTGHIRPQEIIVVGAHYDTVPGSPGANDNGSAVVANLALARAFARLMPDRTVRFAFFVNEEFP